jgi:putative transposase
MKFGFIAKHRGIWPAEWLCEALGVSRGGFYAWLTRPCSRRSRSDEKLGAKVRSSFFASDRTYGARRVWRDMLAEGVSCGLHRIERLMRLQALKARPRRRRLPPDLGERQVAVVAANVLDIAASKRPLPTANGSPTSPMSGPRRAGSMWLRSSICSLGAWSAGR